MTNFKDFKKFELKVEKIFQKGKQFNMIDRFYYYLIKTNQIKDQIVKLDLTLNEYSEFLYRLFFDFETRRCELKSLIIKSYGLYNIKVYKTTKHATILSNPNLLGITPFLFNTSSSEWYNYLKNDVEKFGNYNFYDLEQIILSSLDEALSRLNLSAFTIVDFNSNKIKDLNSDGLFSLLVDDVFELIENNETNEIINQNNLIKNTTGVERIILDNYNTGNIVDILIGSFKSNNVLNNMQKKEIRKFVSMIFVNKTGKRLKFKEILDFEFIDSNIKHLTETLKSKDKGKCEYKTWTNKKLNELICSINPTHYKLKTIESYY